MRIFSFIAFGLLVLSACTPAPPVEQSRSVLWQRYGDHSIDDILLAWGTPAKETKLTDGSRLITYHRAFTYDAASPYESTSGCEATFLAPPPDFIVNNVALKGDASECAGLVKNGPGFGRTYYVPPPGFPGGPGFGPGTGASFGVYR